MKVFLISPESLNKKKKIDQDHVLWVIEAVLERPERDFHSFSGRPRKIHFSVARVNALNIFKHEKSWNSARAF